MLASDWLIAKEVSDDWSVGEEEVGGVFIAYGRGTVGTGGGSISVSGSTTCDEILYNFHVT